MFDTERAMKWLLCGMLCIAVCGCTEPKKPVPADKSMDSATSPATKDPANTGVNVRDRDSAAKTPLAQSESSADIKITADIRKRVVDSKMSVDAQNVKIITQDGKVTLRGPVKTDQEKQAIEKIANDVAGGGNVDNQLEVRGN